MTTLRLLSLSLLAAAAFPAGALATHASVGPFPMRPAAVAQPLTGTGENVKLVANLDIGSAEEIELAGDHAYVTGPKGLHIVDISNPLAPREVSTVCEGGFGDVGLNADATIAILGADSGGNACQKGTTGGVAVIDVADKAAPKVLSYIDTPRGAHTATIDRDLVIINNYDAQYRKAEIYSIADPRNPKLIGTWNVNGTAFHDSYVDHRPDGKTLLYGASITAADVVNFSDPTKPASLQRIYDPEVGIQHQLEPNHKRDVLIATDEYGGGAAGPGCGKSPSADPTYQVPVVGAPQDLGAVHFYKATPDGLFSNNGVDKLSTFNLPAQANNEPTNGCTAHVFWQAPDQNKFTIAWYGRGVRVVDFTDPAKPKQTGFFVATNANTWSVKPHRGYLFASDLNRGLDVYKFTGAGWPADAGPAEVQRAAQMGVTRPRGTVPPPAAAPAPGAQPQPQRSYGRFSFRVTLRKRLPGIKARRVKLRFLVRDASNRIVARASVRRRSRARRASFRLGGRAEAGGYRWYLKHGNRRLAAGGFQVRPSAGTTVPAGRTLVLRVR